MSLNKSQLVDEIKTVLEGYTFKVTLPDGSEQWRKLYDFDQVLEGTPTNFNPALLLIQTIIDKLFDHIISNLEINGIKTSLNVGLNSVFTSGVPVPTDGGTALQTAWKLFTQSGTADQATQYDGGSGYVQ